MCPLSRSNDTLLCGAGGAVKGVPRIACRRLRSSCVSGSRPGPSQRSEEGCSRGADDAHFETIKRDSRSRVQDTAITAEALLPDGPYNLWKGGETSRRVKDLAGAFAQLPHLPKMLKSQAIIETLVEGCVQGTFVLRLTRPDRTFRTWWRIRPDEAALNDPAMELVLPEAAELGELASSVLVPSALPELWNGEEITVQAVADYFDGKKVVQIDRGGFKEPVHVPRATADVINEAVSAAVESGHVWLLSGPASLLGEPIPTGVLTPTSRLRTPPAPIPAASILPANLPSAWKDGSTTALAVATALSQASGQTLPWKTVRDVIGGSIQARFIALAEGSGPWPCELASAGAVKLGVAPAGASGAASPATGAGGKPVPSNIRVAAADFEPAQMQDLGDLIPAILDLRARAKVPIRFHVRIEVGEAAVPPPPEVLEELNKTLEPLGGGFKVA